MSQEAIEIRGESLREDVLVMAIEVKVIIEEENQGSIILMRVFMI
jgi:hypothetical protein